MSNGSAVNSAIVSDIVSAPTTVVYVETRTARIAAMARVANDFQAVGGTINEVEGQNPEYSAFSTYTVAYGQSDAHCDAIVAACVSAGMDTLGLIADNGRGLLCQVPSDIWYRADQSKASLINPEETRTRLAAGADPLAYIVAAAKTAGLRVAFWVRGLEDEGKYYDGTGGTADWRDPLEQGNLNVTIEACRDKIVGKFLWLIETYLPDVLVVDYLRRGSAYNADTGAARTANIAACEDILTRTRAGAATLRPGLELASWGHFNNNDINQGRNNAAWLNSGLLDVVYTGFYGVMEDLGQPFGDTPDDEIINHDAAIGVTIPGDTTHTEVALIPENLRSKVIPMWSAFNNATTTTPPNKLRTEDELIKAHFRTRVMWPWADGIAVWNLQRIKSAVRDTMLNTTQVQTEQAKVSHNWAASPDVNLEHYRSYRTDRYITDYDGEAITVAAAGALHEDFRVLDGRRTVVNVTGNSTLANTEDTGSFLLTGCTIAGDGTITPTGGTCHVRSNTTIGTAAGGEKCRLYAKIVATAATTVRLRLFNSATSHALNKDIAIPGAGSYDLVTDVIVADGGAYTGYLYPDFGVNVTGCRVVAFGAYTCPRDEVPDYFLATKNTYAIQQFDTVAGNTETGGIVTTATGAAISGGTHKAAAIRMDNGAIAGLCTYGVGNDEANFYITVSPTFNHDAQTAHKCVFMRADNAVGEYIEFGREAGTDCYLKFKTTSGAEVSDTLTFPWSAGETLTFTLSITSTTYSLDYANLETPANDAEISGAHALGEFSRPVHPRYGEHTRDDLVTFYVLESGQGTPVPNEAPQFASSPVPVGQEDEAYTYNVTVTDADVGDTITLTAPVLPAWLGFVDNGGGSGTLSGTPLTGNVGSNAVTLRANDGTVSADQNFSIEVSAAVVSEDWNARVAAATGGGFVSNFNDETAGLYSLDPTPEGYNSWDTVVKKSGGGAYRVDTYPVDPNYPSTNFGTTLSGEKNVYLFADQHALAAGEEVFYSFRQYIPAYMAEHQWEGAQGKQEEGTHNGSSGAAVLTDSGQSWTVNEFVGRRVYNDTDGSSGLVTANTATTVTATLSGGTDNDWDNGDDYKIRGFSQSWKHTIVSSVHAAVGGTGSNTNSETVLQGSTQRGYPAGYHQDGVDTAVSWNIGLSTPCSGSDFKHQPSIDRDPGGPAPTTCDQAVAKYGGLYSNATQNWSGRGDRERENGAFFYLQDAGIGNWVTFKSRLKINPLGQTASPPANEWQVWIKYDMDASWTELVNRNDIKLGSVPIKGMWLVPYRSNGSSEPTRRHCYTVYDVVIVSTSDIAAPAEPQTALKTAADATSVGGFTEVTGMTGFTQSLLRWNNTLGQPQVAFSYACKGNWDHIRKQIVLCFGIHATSDGTAHRIEYDDATDAWSTIDTTGVGYGHPYAEHAMDPDRQRLLFRNYSSASCRKLDLRTGLYSDTSNFSGTGSSDNQDAGAITYSEHRGKFQLFDERVGFTEYDWDTDTWTLLHGIGTTDTGGAGTLHNGMEYSFKHRCTIFGGGNTTAATMMVDKDGVFSIMPNAPADWGSTFNMITVDPVSGSFIYIDETGLYEMSDPLGSPSWVKILDDLEMPALFSNSNAGQTNWDVISVPCPTYGGIIFVWHDETAGTRQMWFYRHAS